MFDFCLVWYLFVRYLKNVVRYMNRKRNNIAVHIGKLGTAAYTAAFVYAIEKGIDFNFLKLTVIGIVVVAMAEKVKR